MLDPNFIRENAEQVRKIINSGRGKPDKANVDKWLNLDQKRKELQQRIEELNRERNALAHRGKDENVEGLKEEGRRIKEEVAKVEEEFKDVNAQWQEILDWMPNMPVSEEAMPFGGGEEDNPVDKAWLPGTGYVDSQKLGKAEAKVDYMPNKSVHWDEKLEKPKHHTDLGKELGIIDNEQSAITSGSRFTYLRGDAVLLQFAIQQLMFKELLARGFTPTIPPILVKERVLYGSSHFPESKDQIYKIESNYVEGNSDLYLLGSSEPANFAYYMDKTLQESQLPIKIFAYTACFRSEVGSWGKDVKGIKRVHQFDKIEMNSVCTPEQSQTIFKELLSINEWLLQTLELPYRLARKCTGDAGYLASAEQIDPEGWLPGQQEFIELGTDTNTTDFQARRLNIKYKDKDGKSHYANTVNDTGVAMGRMIIAILDNYQQSDGSIKIPEALVEYVGKEFIKKD